MRRFYGILAITIALTLLCSCENVQPSSAGPSESPAVQTSPSPTVTPVPKASPFPAVQKQQSADIYRNFLSDNYQKLSDDFYGGISGIGFIDLDLDGDMEMIIFDSGASASMGVQFFDIIDGKVECVSANLQNVGKDFGGSHFSDVVVNANYFDDFRLMKDKTSGKEFFLVKSGNGAVDFSYSEIIRFGNDDGALTLDSLMYKYENYDVDSGETTSENYKIGSDPVSGTKYTSEYDKLFQNSVDTGYEAKGVFVWEAEYETNLNGLLAMTDKALSMYTAVSDS